MSRKLPGPKGHPLTGSLPEFRRDMFSFLRGCANDYGPLCGFRLATVPCCLVSDPEIIGEVLQPRTDSLIKPWDLRQLKIVLGRGLLTNEGESWRRQRKLIQPAFHNDRIKEYANLMTARTAQTVSRWQDGQVREIHSDMMALTLDIVAQCLFGTKIGPETETVGNAMTGISDHFAAFLERGLPVPFWIPTPANRRMQRHVKQLDAVIYRFIAERQQQASDQNDLLGILLQLSQSADGALTARQLRDEVITLLLAGHETTALALTWTLYLLARHPDITARLCAELDNVLQGKLPDSQDVRSMPLLNRVLMESMRLYPPAWGIGREAAHPFELEGYTLRRGTQIFMLQFLMHRDRHYFENPESFDPDRWTPEFMHALPKYAYFPFGGGPRFCIGAGFANMEANLLLAVILQRFHTELVPGHPVQLQPAITLRPRYGLKMLLRKRQDAPVAEKIS